MTDSMEPRKLSGVGSPSVDLCNLFFHMELQTQTVSRGLVSSIVTPPFLVAFLMLGLAAGLSGPVASWLRIKQGKQPLALKAPLSAMEVEAIAPYRVIRRRVLEPMAVDAAGHVPLVLFFSSM